MTLGEAISACIGEGGFDSSSSNVSRATVARWINAAHTEMVRKARYLREIVELGPTVNGQSDYAVPANVGDIHGLSVGGVPYIRKGLSQLRRLQGGLDRALYSLTVAGFFTPTFTSAGASNVTLWPTPVTAGQSVLADAAVLPGILSDESSDALIVPSDFCEGVIDGAIALGLSRIDENDQGAAAPRARFERQTEELRRHVNARVNSGPSQLRVVA